MTNPFHFSLRQALCALACFAVAAGSFTAFVAHIDDPAALLTCLLLFVGCVSLGVGVGALFGSAFRGKPKRILAHYALPFVAFACLTIWCFWLPIYLAFQSPDSSWVAGFAFWFIPPQRMILGCGAFNGMTSSLFGKPLKGFVMGAMVGIAPVAVMAYYFWPHWHRWIFGPS
jgi:hypothetical protein